MGDADENRLNPAGQLSKCMFDVQPVYHGLSETVFVTLGQMC